MRLRTGTATPTRRRAAARRPRRAAQRRPLPPPVARHQHPLPAARPVHIRPELQRPPWPPGQRGDLRPRARRRAGAAPDRLPGPERREGRLRPVSRVRTDTRAGTASGPIRTATPVATASVLVRTATRVGTASVPVRRLRGGPGRHRPGRADGMGAAGAERRTARGRRYGPRPIGARPDDDRYGDANGAATEARAEAERLRAARGATPGGTDRCQGGTAPAPGRRSGARTSPAPGPIGYHLPNGGGHRRAEPEDGRSRRQRGRVPPTGAGRPPLRRRRG
jgi:hypothetical protein